MLGLDETALLELELLAPTHLHVAAVELLLLLQVGRARVGVGLA